MILFKKLRYKAMFIFICLILITLIIVSTFSRYDSNASSTADVQTALYLLNENYNSINIEMGTMTPRDEAYTYTFSISNNDGRNRTETNLEYELSIKTTTNLPLEYELYLNQNYKDQSAVNIIKTNEIMQDGDGTYFRDITTDKKNFGFQIDETNIYTLVVYFDSEYNDINYQNIIESIEVNVSSKQII